MTEISLTIPLEPPTVNHYVKHARNGRHYKTKEALSWLSTVTTLAMGQRVDGKSHEVSYVVFQGHGSRGDVDNYAKCILDSLVGAGVLRSDATVIDMRASKRRDRENPRTEIHVRRLT
jgi:crossover junction endodeoxyribonuclease RusA